jgi:hypothetical protein
MHVHPQERLKCRKDGWILTNGTEIVGGASLACDFRKTRMSFVLMAKSEREETWLKVFPST